MALHATFDDALVATHKPRMRLSRKQRRIAAQRQRDPHDLALIFWSIAMPACLLFWAAVAYGIHSAL